MNYQIDLDWLRKDLVEYYGTAMTNGIPTAVMNLTKVDRLTAQELVELAQKNGFDLKKYFLLNPYSDDENV